MDYDVMIVGAGIAGLSAGAILAHRGRTVLVLEKDSSTGGRAKYIEKDGYIVDHGIHFNRFGKRGSMAMVLREIGECPKFNNAGIPLIYKNGEFHPMPRGPLDFIKTGLLTPTGRMKMFRIFLSIPLSNPWKHLNSSVGEWLYERSPTEDIVELVSTFTGSCLICPDINKASVREVQKFLEKVTLSKHPIGYLKGGWKALFNCLESRILDNGEILTNTKIKEIRIENGVVTGVITDKTSYSGRAVICTVPFQHIPDILDLRELSPELEEYARNVEPTSGVTLDFGLRERVSSSRSFFLTYTPLTIGCFSSNVEPSLAPEGRQLGSWFCFIPPEKIADREYAKGRIQALRDLIDEMFPGIWKKCEWERPMILDIIDAAVPKVGQSFVERPKFRSNIKNLYFAGDSTGGKGLGGDIAFDSALKCARLVDKYLK